MEKEQMFGPDTAELMLCLLLGHEGRKITFRIPQTPCRGAHGSFDFTVLGIERIASDYEAGSLWGLKLTGENGEIYSATYSTRRKRGLIWPETKTSSLAA